MEVRFTCTGEEVWRMSTFRWRRTRPLQRQIIPGLILIGLLALIVIFSPPDELFSHLLPILIAFLVLILLVVGIRRMQHVRANRAARLQGEHIITIGPEGFRHRSQRGESLVAWHVFKEITADPSALYFLTEVLNTGSTVVHGIPRRAFATPQAADAFLSQALTFWTNRPAIPPPGPAGTGAPYERWG